MQNAVKETTWVIQVALKFVECLIVNVIFF